MHKRQLLNKLLYTQLNKLLNQLFYTQLDKLALSYLAHNLTRYLASDVTHRHHFAYRRNFVDFLWQQQHGNI